MEEPCILLLDEMEKLFTQGDDSGVTGRLLEQLLWWLQEHKSRVLTVMTTNAIDAIPKEVYRPGRINEIFTMKGLDEQGAFKLTNALLATFDENYVNQKVADAVSEIIDDTLNLNKEVSHAQVTEITLDVIKEHYFNKEED
jgi:SpoVK/Ycf46/Vps4 family AAA+-type ATPase